MVDVQTGCDDAARLGDSLATGVGALRLHRGGAYRGGRAPARRSHPEGHDRAERVPGRYVEWIDRSQKGFPDSCCRASTPEALMAFSLCGGDAHHGGAELVKVGHAAARAGDSPAAQGALAGPRPLFDRCRASGAPQSLQTNPTHDWLSDASVAFFTGVALFVMALLNILTQCPVIGGRTAAVSELHTSGVHSRRGS